VLALVALAVMGAAALIFTRAFTERILAAAAESPAEAAATAARAVRMTLSLLSVIPLAVGMYLISVSIRAWQANEFPPPGTRVLRDTVVTLGPGSRRWALAGFVTAVFLIAGGTTVLVLAWRLAASLIEIGSRPVIP